MPHRIHTMREALEDNALFGTVLAGETWQAWRALLIGAMGEELADAERAIYAELTGRDREPGEQVEELWCLVGRRGGKTRAGAVAAVYLATCVDYDDVLAPGERGSVPVMSASVWQASKALSYVSGVFATVPELGRLVENETADTIALRSRVDIEVRPANWRTIRGLTAVGAIGDEIAFWRSETTLNPDAEILDAVRPSLATTGGPLILISSVHAKKGEAYKAFRQHHGPNGDPRIVVAHAPSRMMNPSLPQSVVDRALERDEPKARAEYLSTFRSDLEDFVSRETVEAAIEIGLLERAPLSAVRYVAFIDPAGGSGADSMTLAIAHAEGDVAVLDAIREKRPPFSPAAVVDEFAEVLKSYRVTKIQGDKWGGEFAREPFRKLGIDYEASAQPKSDIYAALLPRLNSGRVQLLDQPRLISQLCSLERRTSRSGRDSIDHAPNAHDDVANAVAGALVGVAASRRPMVISEELLRASAMPGPYTARNRFSRRNVVSM